MKVTLIDSTGDARHAANLLVFTKQTRLEMRPGLMKEIEQWADERILEELTYMANTIPSSWEFVSYTFLIEDVTRAFTHQFVRTRTGSYAQQTMRVLNKKGWTYGTGPTIMDDEGRREAYCDTMAEIAAQYDWLIKAGAEIEDARGILPTNIHTNIVAKFDLRTLCDMFRKRASSRTQGEYREVIEAMKTEVVAVHPWAKLFLDRTFDKAAADLESTLKSMALPGSQPLALRADELTRMIKLIDQMRMTA